MSQVLRTLVLYKRHQKNCLVHKSRVPLKNRQYWMECDCPIWIRGRTPTGDIVPMQSTRFTDLKQAEALRASLIAQVRPDSTKGLPVAECFERYLASLTELSTRTKSQHKLCLSRLRQFLEAQGVLYIRDMTVDHLETFKTAGLPEGMESTTKATIFSKIRCFLRVAFRRDWITEHLAEKVTSIEAHYEQKEPYTEAEIKALFDGASAMHGGTSGYAAKPKTFCLLLELMLETGMRVGDAVNFDPTLLERGSVFWVYTYRQQKQQRSKRTTLHEAYLTEDLKQRIEACEWMSPHRPFWYGGGRSTDEVAKAVYERMQSIGTKAGIADCRPHRLRDTFAVNRLIAGMHLEDVTRLLGHSSVKVTETYYAKWILRRKHRLERVLFKSLMHT